MLAEPSGSAEVGDEAAVDLDLVERKALQIAQRGIAGAEIVERDPYPDGAKLMQDGKRRVVVADQDRLGDLELEPARRQAGGRERCDDLQRQRAALELDRRDVDRKPDVVRASSRPRCRRVISTHSPSWLISPVSSAIGMNSAGETMPRSGWRQRSSASQPVISSSLQARGKAGSRLRAASSAIACRRSISRQRRAVSLRRGPPCAVR